ncbi:MAG TPA: class I SAM-dependent methyltransferase [Vicinamibacterales bacterium]|nr:class I SAM-dependent methyltransferase [Vicinamibacterales bacterium]
MKRAREGWRGWDDYAAFYDWENAQTVQRRDVQFWERLAAAADGPVLELGCGTGRITVPVARAGVRIVGVDRSLPMLDRASRKLRRARVAGRAALVRADIRHLPFRRGRFPLVMAPYGILQSLTRERDLTATLDAVARVLPKGGRFGIDLVPDLPRWSEYQARRTLSGRMGRQTTVSLVESVTQDRARGLTIFDQRYLTSRNGARRQHRFTLTFRTLSIRQMTGRLERAGFAIDAVLGDYRGGPWDARADVWVILASKR